MQQHEELYTRRSWRLTLHSEQGTPWDWWQLFDEARSI